MLVISHIIRANRISLMSLAGPMSGGWSLLTHSGFSHINLQPTWQHNCLLSHPCLEAPTSKGGGDFEELSTHMRATSRACSCSPLSSWKWWSCGVSRAGWAPGGVRAVSVVPPAVCAEPSASCLGAAGRQGVRTWEAETEVMLHTSQGATGSWKRQEGPSPAASEGAQPC